MNPAVRIGHYRPRLTESQAREIELADQRRRELLRLMMPGR